VLPLLPIVFGSAASAHRFGPLALAGGVTLSYVAIGLFIATIGFAIGLDGDMFRIAGAIVMILLGAWLVSARLQRKAALVGAPIEAAAGNIAARLSPAGPGGQFVLGLTLGAVWSPCVGPTLGAAAALAASRRHLGEVALVMILFGLGAAAPLVLIGIFSRAALLRWRGRMARAGTLGRTALGVVMLATAAIILTGLDRDIETALVSASPQWLTDLSTRF